MLRLSKMTDYAVVVMGEMARRPQDTMTATGLAERTSLPAPTVQKILKLIARDGLAASIRGAAGGYRLARPAAEISMADVIAAIDGPIALTECVDGAPHACGVGQVCAMRGNWDRVNRAVQSALESVSLADMSQPAGAWALPPAERRPPLAVAAD
jgi:FeS assembly SUF system regulator